MFPLLGSGGNLFAAHAAKVNRGLVNVRAPHVSHYEEEEEEGDGAAAEEGKDKADDGVDCSHVVTTTALNVFVKLAGTGRYVHNSPCAAWCSAG